MSDEDRGAPAGAASYNVAELRARITVCFSAQEIRRLAAELGATDVETARGAGEAARALVRYFERQGDLAVLVAKVRQARPLVEWPKPRQPPRPRPPRVPQAMQSPDEPLPAPPELLLDASDVVSDVAPPVVAGDADHADAVAVPADAVAEESAPVTPRAEVSEVTAAAMRENDADLEPTVVGSREVMRKVLAPEREGLVPDLEPTVVGSRDVVRKAMESIPDDSEARDHDRTLPSGKEDPVPAPPAESRGEDAGPAAGLRWKAPAKSDVTSPAAEADAPPAPSEPAAPAAGDAPLTDPYAEAWPGTEPAPAPAPPPPRGMDPRMLIGLAVLMLIAVTIAYLAGRASSGSQRPSSPEPTGSASPRPRRPEGLATRAADAVARRIEAVARACEIATGPGAEVMRRATAQCGPPPAIPPTRPTPPAAPEDAPPRGAAGDAVRPRPAVAAPAAPVVAGNAACLSSCERGHRACKSSRCGDEPTEGSKYKRYQDCLSECLREASKCRLGCT